MKKVHKLFLLFLMTFVGIGNVLADNYEGKLFSVGALSTQLETGKWYFLFNNGTGKFAYENDAMALKQGGSPEGISVSGNTGYMFQLVETDTEGKYFIQTGFQHFIPNPGSSVKPADEKGYGLKVTPIEETEGHFNISGSIRKLTAPTTGGDLIGGSSAMEGSIGDWSFYGVKLFENKEYTIPNNEIWYEASEKLKEESISSSHGFHYNRFNVSMVSHTFNDGKGIIKFNGDVTSIGSEAFYYCFNLTSIILPNSVKNITGAFLGCVSLHQITIPNSVTYIGQQTFQGCSGLTNITMSNSVTGIGKDAFNGCTALASIEIPNSVTSIGNYAFASCKHLTNIEIPNSVTNIGDWAFAQCSGLTDIKIGKSVTSIGMGAFSNCLNLKCVYVDWQAPFDLPSYSFSNVNLKNCTLHVPKGTKSLYQQADVWKEFGNIVEQGIPNNEIWYEASEKLPETNDQYSDGLHTNAFNVSTASHVFSNGHGVITFNGDVTSIGESAFYYSGLTSIEIPNSVTSFGKRAFYFCSGLTNITIPNSVTSIGESAFYGCYGLTSIVVASGNTKYDSRNNCNAIIETATNTLITGCKKTIIPNSVTNIGDNAFGNCLGLTSIVIPNSVTSIGYSAFNTCSGLTSIAIPNSVTSIGTFAFSGCSGLTSIEIPNSVTNIEYGAFDGCSGLTSIKIPNSVTSIGIAAFSYCSGLTSITIPNSVTSIGSYAFESCSGLTSIVVASGNTKYDSRNNCNAIIETATNTLITGCKNTIIPNSVTSIGKGAFYLCKGLTSIEIPNSVTSIGEFAFYNCSGLTSITIPNSVTSIGKGAFYLCKGLTSIEIPNSVISIGESAFYNCSGLTSVKVNWYIPLDINSNVFGRVDLPNGTLYIPAGTKSLYEQADVWKEFGAIVEDEILATSISLNQTTVGIKLGENFTLTATVLPSNTTNKSVTWKTSDVKIATVDSNGLVTAIKAGTATITATTTDGSNLSATCKVTVDPVLATSISLSRTTASVKTGETLKLTYTLKPDNVTSKDVKWSSSDTKIATVDNNGMVTAIKVGTATITATTTDGTNLSATCKVTVDPVLATSISLSRTSASVKIGETLKLTYTLKPDNVTSKDVQWSSSDTKIATVDNNGMVTAIKVGTATITATTTDGTNLSATCKVTVDPVLATSISLSRTSASVKTGETLKLTYTLKPDNVTSTAVKWSSSDTKIATVDNNGMVTAIKVGTATITATTTDGTNLSATCKVTVDPILATSITLNRTSASIKIGETLKLTCTLKPDNVTSQDVQWSSSDTKIATVDNNGVVTAVKVGTATITVTTTDGSNLSATCKVTVDPILATSISISSSSLDLKVGHSATLSATVLPENATNKKKEWSSSNPNIATVSEGIVTAVSPGTCVIKVKTVDGSNLTATCTVAVADIPVSTLSIDKTSIDLLVEEETLITASVYPADATNKALVWSSSNGSVASVDNGKVKALNAGSAIISVRTTDGSDKMETCNVTVRKHPQTIEWNQDLSYITYGGELIGLKATASSGLPVVFSSSNDNVASIIDMGSIVYLNPGNPGSSKITATQGGNYYYESVSVVKDANVIDPSGVENVTDSSEKYTIYDIAGLRIGTYTQQEYDELISNKLIPAGIYIVNGLKKFIGK